MSIAIIAALVLLAVFIAYKVGGNKGTKENKSGGRGVFIPPITKPGDGSETGIKDFENKK